MWERCRAGEVTKEKRMAEEVREVRAGSTILVRSRCLGVKGRERSRNIPRNRGNIPTAKETRGVFR